MHAFGITTEITRTLATGRIAHTPRHLRNALPPGINGVLKTATFVDRHSGTRVPAVLKTIRQGGAQEVFASEVARALRMDHLVPASGRRGDATAATEYVRGTELRRLGIVDAETLERTLREGLQLRHPSMSATDLTSRARVDRQLVQVFDYLLGNADRHGKNALYDAQRGRLSLVDHGLIERFPGRTSTPAVKSLYLGGAGSAEIVPGHRRIELTDEVVSMLAATDRTRIARAFRQMQRDTAGQTLIGRNALRLDDAFLTRINKRLDAAISNRAIDVHVVQNSFAGPRAPRFH